MLSSKLKINDIELKGKRVIMRVDYNVPLNKNCEIQDERRIKSTMQTIKKALEKGSKSIVLCSHLGRPNGIKNPKLSLKHIIPSLNKNLEIINASKVNFIPSIDSDEYKKALNPTKNGSIFLLENLRFYPEEEGKGLDKNKNKIKPSKDEIDNFRSKLSALGDVFIFDAFAAAHRAHSSVVGINLPIRAAGLLMAKELSFFSKALENPKRPFLSILGGAKVSDKILLIENLIDRVDEMIIGGGMSFTFLKVLKGMEIGTSLFDEEGSKLVKKIMEKAKSRNVKIHFPVDFITADKFSPDANTGLCTEKEGIPKDLMALDCGKESRIKFSEVVMRAKTIVWNGPLGVFEFEKFSNGTYSVLDAVSKATEKDDVTSIIGGGDTASAAEKRGVSEKMSHVSTGGGASLELLEGKILPGVQYLSS